MSAAPERALRLSTEQRSAVFQACSLLLGYPTDTWETVLDAVDATSDGFLPDTITRDLSAFTSWARATGRQGVEKQYVETFDQKRRCCLELSYFATGDTRQRGIALTIFRDLYRAVGFELTVTDLPDFLPNLLELQARCTDPEDAALVEAVMSSHREGVEILHAALASLNSPWSTVLSALRQALPDVDEATSYRLQKLVRQGPPQELVGVAGPQALPWPTPSAEDTAPELTGFVTAVAATTARTTGVATAPPNGQGPRRAARSAAPSSLPLPLQE